MAHYYNIMMALIKEDSEDIKIEETLRVKEEDDTEETGWFYCHI